MSWNEFVVGLRSNFTSPQHPAQWHHACDLKSTRTEVLTYQEKSAKTTKLGLLFLWKNHLFSIYQHITGYTDLSTLIRPPTKMAALGGVVRQWYVNDVDFRSYQFPCTDFWCTLSHLWDDWQTRKLKNQLPGAGNHLSAHISSPTQVRRRRTKWQSPQVLLTDQPLSEAPRGKARNVNVLNSIYSYRHSN